MTRAFGSQLDRQAARVALWATGLVALLYTSGLDRHRGVAHGEPHGPAR